ncbi:peptide/nickel transport system ATP-binding protein [Caldanaerobius fijiensis DSM 17918]|uniref:Peptide/nickel transport system ATP-binding protein n=1 Tax=Caldanaerobius fijiensis DSM 17918 TaxID=1121256 RepID=A0A1M4XWE7_9THEO|nr:ABC transporter ATP-binding protein [Caldanaerobius fijiensis]SHE97811.1 peptide/nickel transport system ATP-binding protein [Caldanaerobius fijiensis DSM 17918]
MDPLMSIRDLYIIFEHREGFIGKPKTVEAVSGVNLDIYPGEIIAVVGESGCGKTTLGKAICGLYKPSKGSLIFQGKDISKLNKKEFKEFRRNVQMVHQDSYAALNPTRTIYQSLSAPIIRNGFAKDRKQAYEIICELLETVELTPPELYLEKFPHQLSGGQRQRILMARAISLRPKLIVADEPVSMIDVSLRISILDLMAHLNKQFGIAFIYITHDLSTARYIASNGRIAVMYLGKIIETGQLNKVLSHPHHPYLQALLSAVPIPDPDIARNMKQLPLRSWDMPDPTSPPPGCRFNPRCPYAREICQQNEPILRNYEDDMVSCHLAEKVPAWKIG